MSVTIKDVAKRAGVSIATVSHVINKNRAVSAESTQRVEQAIEELGYYPNRLVGSLRGKKTYSVGMVIPSISNETFGRLAELIQKQLFSRGYNLYLCITGYDARQEELALNSFLTKKVDAVMAIPVSGDCPKLVEIQQRGLPVILVDREVEGLDTDVVTADNFEGERQAVQYLIRCGHRRIGYVDRQTEQSHSRRQREGYLAALAGAGIADSYILSAPGHYHHAGVDAAQEMMRRHPEVTAIACYYDLMAFGVIRGLVDLGYRVPEDVSVIGYDNMQFTEVTRPALTTVALPLEKMAARACRVLLERLEGGAAMEQGERMEFPTKLVVRESVQGLPGD